MKEHDGVVVLLVARELPWVIRKSRPIVVFAVYAQRGETLSGLQQYLKAVLSLGPKSVRGSLQNPTDNYIQLLRLAPNPEGRRLGVLVECQ